MVRDPPILCTARRVIIRATTTDLWGQYWSLIISQCNNNRIISVGRMHPGDTTQKLTCRWLKNCNTCWRQGWLHWENRLRISSLTLSATILMQCVHIMTIVPGMILATVGLWRIRSNIWLTLRRLNLTLLKLLIWSFHLCLMLYPKIFPPIFLNTFQVRSSNCSRKPKGWPDKLSPKAVYLILGFHFAPR